MDISALGPVVDMQKESQLHNLDNHTVSLAHPYNYAVEPFSKQDTVIWSE